MKNKIKNHDWKSTWLVVKIILGVSFFVLFLGSIFYAGGKVAHEHQIKRIKEYRLLTAECLTEHKTYYCKALLQNWYME